MGERHSGQPLFRWSKPISAALGCSWRGTFWWSWSTFLETWAQRILLFQVPSPQKELSFMDQSYSSQGGSYEILGSIQMQNIPIIIKNKCWTADHLASKNLPHPELCVLWPGRWNSLTHPHHLYLCLTILAHSASYCWSRPDGSKGKRNQLCWLVEQSKSMNWQSQKERI